MSKKTAILVISIVVLMVILLFLIILTVNEINMVNPRNMGNRQMGFISEQETEKETTANDVREGEQVADKNIDLTGYNSNVTLTKSGEYTVNGEFGHTLLVNSKEPVTLILNGVTIKNETTAAIANIGTGTLTIRLADGTVNTLSDGGSSDYDACIYSIGALVIEGNGTLNVYGNQDEGEGIATETNDITINGGHINIECADDGLNAGGDGGIITINNGNVYIKASGDGIDSNKDLVINNGYVYTMGSSVGGDAGIDTDGSFNIHGGEVIALGSDMLQSPNSTSKQKSICFNLTSKVATGTIISLKNESESEIVTFEAKEDFKTLIVSNSKITAGTYYLYQNGEKTSYSVTVK